MKSIKPISILLLTLLVVTAVYAESFDLKKEITPQVSNEPAEVRAYKHEDGSTITEYKSGGKVWMIKVHPSGNFPAYYLYDDEGNGMFERRIMGNKLPSAPMWVIKRF